VIIMEAYIMEVSCMTNGKGPVFFGDDAWPVCHGVQKDGSSGVLEDTDGTFSYAVLPVATDSVKCELLAFHVTGNFEGFAGIHAIVGANGLDGNVVFAGECFEFCL